MSKFDQILKLLSTYSTLNRITGFWLDERSTINPKLYSPGVPITFLSEVDTKFSEINRLRKATIKHPKTSALFLTFPKLTRRRPKISEVDPKNSEGVRGSTEVFRRFPTLDRRVSKVSKVNTNGSEEIYTKLTVTAFWLADRNFVEYTINKKSGDLLVQFMINRFSWIWKFSNCTRLKACAILRTFKATRTYSSRMYSRSCDFLYEFDKRHRD